MKPMAIALSLAPSDDFPDGGVMMCKSGTYAFIDREAGTVSLTPHRGETEEFKNVELVMTARSYRRLLEMITNIRFCGRTLHD